MHLNPVLVQNLSGVTTILKSAVVYICDVMEYYDGGIERTTCARG